MNPDPSRTPLWQLGMLLALVLLPAAANAQRYELVWSDEFDTLDRTTWKHWIGTAFNNELQYYTARDTNSYTRDGLLYLWAQSELFGGQSYTSARIESRPRGGHTYGRFEARAKMPSGIGLWPAIWMLPVNGNWPSGGEIDIMEWRGDLPQRTYGTVHFARDGAHRHTGTTWDLPQGTFSDDFHVFAIEWDETGIRWFVDDYQFQELRHDALEADPFPFNKDFYWILNVAVGGDFLPNPPAGSTFRQAMIVDYVRVYQDANQKPTVTLSALPDTVQAGTTLALSVSAADADGQVDSVAVYVNGTRMASAAGEELAYAYTAASDGCYEIEARAYDNDRGEGSAQQRVVAGMGCTLKAFGEGPLVLPDTLHFSHFDYGGQELAYYDTTPDENTGNAQGNTFRTGEGVDLRPHPERAGDYLVTDIKGGEWLSYTIEVPQEGLYDLTARASAPGGYARIRLQLDNATLVRSMTFTGGTPAQPFVSYTEQGVMLPAGRHVLRATALFEGFELDYLVMARQSTTPVEKDGHALGTRPFSIAPHPVQQRAEVSFALAAPSEVTLQVVDMLGRVVATPSRGMLPAGPHTIAFERAQLAAGVYLLRLVTPEGTSARPLVLAE